MRWIILLALLFHCLGCQALRVYVPDGAPPDRTVADGAVAAPEATMDATPVAPPCSLRRVTALVEGSSAHAVRVTVTTSEPGPVVLRWAVAAERAPVAERSLTVERTATAMLEDLQACTPYRLEVRHGPAGACVETLSVETSDVSWPDRCGEPYGTPLDPAFGGASNWRVYTHDGAAAAVRPLPDLCGRGAGREVSGIELSYSLGPCTAVGAGGTCEGEWVVASREYRASPFAAATPRGAALRLVVGGSERRDEDPPDLEVSLLVQAPSDPSRRCKFMNRIPGAVTGTPSTAYLPLCEFRYRFNEDPDGCEAAGLELARVVALEVGVARRYHPGRSLRAHRGTLSVGDPRVVNGPAPEFVHAPEVMAPDPAVLSAIGASLLRNQAQAAHGLLVSWREDPNPDHIVYHSYNQALALMVLSREVSRATDPALRARYAATADLLARRLLDLERFSGAAWYDCYRERRADRGALERCPLSECVSAPWPGNTSWVLIGLRSYLRDRDPQSTDFVARVNDVMHTSANYLESLQDRVPGSPGCVNQGTEASVSAYFGLLAAGRAVTARRVRDCLLAPRPADCSARSWDTTERRFWAANTPRSRSPDPCRGGGVMLRPAGDASYALDLLGGWGARLLTVSGAPPEDLARNLGLARTIFATRSRDRLAEGLCDIAAPCHGPTTEFGAMAAASGIRDGMCILRRIERGLRASEGEYRASREPFEGGRPGAWAETWTGLPTQCWVYLAYAGDGLDRL
ncbi:MAG: hypothetical protein HY909_24020 [Deltaproteobacteria bacterium]|nr:hypothetical protein [Deltaproteobacteria bacterium]